MTAINQIATKDIQPNSINVCLTDWLCSWTIAPRSCPSAAREQ